MINISLVTYNTSKTDITTILNSLTNYVKKEWKLIIVDNSPINILEEFAADFSKVEYIHNPTNPGFGAAHNIAIKKTIDEGLDFHFIINPDIHFDNDVISPMVNYMEQNPDVGMMMPKVLNEDGTVQNLPKLLPQPFWLFRRKLRKFDPNGTQFINTYELRNFPKDKIYNVPILSGCFSLFRLAAIKEIGMYDEAFFMYFEDFDLSRRMHQKYKTLYFPQVSVFHGYEAGANKSFKLFKIFLKSMVTYFNKWGWLSDTERKKINRETLSQFK